MNGRVSDGVSTSNVGTEMLSRIVPPLIPHATGNAYDVLHDRPLDGGAPFEAYTDDGSPVETYLVPPYPEHGDRIWNLPGRFVKKGEADKK